MRLIANLLIAVLVGYTLSILINTSVSAATLVGFGIEVSLKDRFDMIVTEWMGLATLYLPIYLVVQSAAFLLLLRVVRSGQYPLLALRGLYSAVGALSLMAVYLAFDTALGQSGVLVASGRTTAGLIAHSATGAVSGLIFCLFRERSSGATA
ncbi:hypothetical protein N9N10_02060 [Luminiphilus sp.]|nr:hypothetical protein [Luminiphilus sp.]MDA8797234.1 hypothetical protein [Luminiphilus sp.]MDA8946943.1 hypothetical protein [Luminiphilus sp.]MDB2312338.1 hypothetical protein [Luminiphilus sp.]MDB2378514.1 hypothetical protein [Luminiphilus sp.]